MFSRVNHTCIPQTWKFKRSFPNRSPIGKFILDLGTLVYEEIYMPIYFGQLLSDHFPFHNFLEITQPLCHFQFNT